MSPEKKKIKLSSDSEPNTLKRQSKSEESLSKRMKSFEIKEDDLQAKRRKNFITACEEVSCKTYFDHRARLLLIYLPSCMKTRVCKHHDKNTIDNNINQMPTYAVESFKIEMKTNVWLEALEVCQMSITPDQYLSADVLRDVVEIMLNAHEDECSENTVREIIDKCQQILAQNFSTHPPCLVKSLRKCYNNFLTSPMDNKDNTFTNRKQFECDKGIVKYCMNRLEFEISSESKDEPLVNIYENTPQEMLQSVQGLHWQKEKFEIFEVLNRPDRIERLMAALESIIELLQFDLGIWHTRYTNNLGCHIMRSHKPLMAYILWSNNVLYTGAVNKNCRQILKLFVHMVHLQYSDFHLKIITTWLNTMIQTFYICETNSNSDYPNTGKYCTAFANEFYKIIAEMPRVSIIRIIEKIEPTFMQHLVALIHIRELLSTDEECIIKILTNFVNKSQWKLFPPSTSDIELSKPLFIKSKNIGRKLSQILKKCLKILSEENLEEIRYPKMQCNTVNNSETQIDINHVIHTIYIALEAYLDSYSVQYMQETWEKLNEQLLEPEIQNAGLSEHSSYTITEQFIKKYRYIYQGLKELVLVLQKLKNNGTLPEAFNIFSNIGLLEL